MDNTKKKDIRRLPITILLILMLLCTWFLYYQSQYVPVDIEKLKESVVIINSCDNYGVHEAAGSGVISYQNKVFNHNAGKKFLGKMQWCPNFRTPFLLLYKHHKPRLQK